MSTAPDERAAEGTPDILIVNPKRVFIPAKCADCATHARRLEDLERERTWLVDKVEPEMGALHYAECPYAPYADTPSWEMPDNPPECTCSRDHKAAYWKARWMLTKGWRDIAERRLEEARAMLQMIRDSDAQTTYPVWPDVIDPLLARLSPPPPGREG